MVILCDFPFHMAARNQDGFTLEVLASRVLHGSVANHTYCCLVDGDELSFQSYADNSQHYYEVTDDIPEGYNNTVADPDMYPQHLDLVTALKAKTRKKIDDDVGDLHDLVADLSKRLAMVERLVIRVLHPHLRGEPTPQYVLDMYLPLLQTYMDGLEAGTIEDRADYEDSYELFSRLADRTAQIAQIVKKEYLDNHPGRGNDK